MTGKRKTRQGQEMDTPAKNVMDAVEQFADTLLHELAQDPHAAAAIARLKMDARDVIEFAQASKIDFQAKAMAVLPELITMAAGLTHG